MKMKSNACEAASAPRSTSRSIPTTIFIEAIRWEEQRPTHFVALQPSGLEIGSVAHSWSSRSGGAAVHRFVLQPQGGNQDCHSSCMLKLIFPLFLRVRLLLLGIAAVEK